MLRTEQDLLDGPYYLAVSPSPDGQSVAVAVIHGESGAGALRVELLDSEGAFLEEIHVFDSLQPLLMSWSPDGRFLAFCQGTVCGFRDGDGRLRFQYLRSHIRWIGFDALSRCWCLSGESLFCIQVLNGGGCSLHREHADAVAAGIAVVAVTRQGDQPVLEWVGGSDSPMQQWPLLLTGKPSVRLSGDNTYLFVAAEARIERDRLRVQIGSVHLETGNALLLFDAVVATGIAAPTFQWFPWKGNSVVILGEIDGQSSVWEATEGGVSRLPGLERFEVFGLAIGANRNLALLVSDMADAAGVSERRLVIAFERADEWQCHTVAHGVADMPTWGALGDELFYVHDDNGGERWHLKKWTPGLSSSQGLGLLASHKPRVHSTVLRGVQGEIVELAGPKDRAGGIIYALGPHRQFLSGLQTSFFHFALYSLLRSLANEGYRVVAVNGPYSVGRGRIRREPAQGDYLDDTCDALAAGAAFLQEAGCVRYGVLAGSLGAFAALHYLAGRSDCCAGALISPVYSSEISSLSPWRSLLQGVGNAPSPHELASQIRTPLQIIHGLQDEVSPASNSSDFLVHLPPQTVREYVSLPEEGHIFQRLSSWRRAMKATSTFLRAHLEGEDTGAQP